MRIKQIVKHSFIAVVAAAFSVVTQAHDPSLHMKNAEAPNCKAMEGMDHSKMDMSDPIIRALMKKCMAQVHAADGAAESAGSSEKSGQAQHEADHGQHKH
ncbi:MAG: hypothetical protein GYB33_00120 [Gammaproteobacteria bacterium]|nr:hypothetical protein [Gammaproteobacteria bacterium]